MLSKKLSSAFNQAFALLPYLLAFSLLILPFSCMVVFAGRRCFSLSALLDQQCLIYLVFSFFAALVAGSIASVIYFNFRAKPLSYWQVGLASSMAALMMLVILIALPNMDICDMDRSRAKRTMADTKWIAEAIENHRCAQGQYPDIRAWAELVKLDPGFEICKEGLRDGWGTLFIISSNSEGYWIISKGGDAQLDVAPYDQYPINHIRWPESDFVFHNGMWIQNPFLDVYMKPVS
jgi:hypothetical protein